MDNIELRFDRLEARDATCELLLHALLIHSINEAPDGHALLDGLSRGVDRILALPEWQDGKSDHAQAAVRQEIATAFGRAANALELQAQGQVGMPATEMVEITQ